VLGGHIVFTLVAFKADERYVLLLGVALDASHEVPGHGRGQRRRSKRGLTVIAEESRNVLLALQPRDVDVEIHPVDALQFECDVVSQDVVDAVW